MLENPHVQEVRLRSNKEWFFNGIFSGIGMMIVAEKAKIEKENYQLKH